MGWAYCGEDSEGRSIGYSIDAICDADGCKKEIHRGLAYVCGDMHGSDEFSCEKYFCENHQTYVSFDGMTYSVCQECADLLEKEEEEVNGKRD